MKKHPIQPLLKEAKGVLRFKQNAIVRHLLDHGGIDLNQIAAMKFSREDREQFAQLIGYSLSGFSDLIYVSAETYKAASRMANRDETPEEARIAALEEELAAIKAALRSAACVAFNKHPDDLE